jgi:hypothetical protein
MTLTSRCKNARSAHYPAKSASERHRVRHAVMQAKISTGPRNTRQTSIPQNGPLSRMGGEDVFHAGPMQWNSLRASAASHDRSSSSSDDVPPIDERHQGAEAPVDKTGGSHCIIAANQPSFGGATTAVTPSGKRMGSENAMPEGIYARVANQVFHSVEAVARPRVRAIGGWGGPRYWQDRSRTGQGKIGRSETRAEISTSPSTFFLLQNSRRSK